MKVLDENKLQAMAAYITDYIHENNGESPKFSEILNYMNMSKSVGYRYLTRLNERGIITYSGKGTLAIAGQEKMKSGFRHIPILGAVICGSPEEQEQHTDGYLAIPEEWVDGECFLLRAYGDSMIDLGIEKGDLILVKRKSEATDGQIVVALTEEGNTLKRIRFEDGKPVLYAENHTYTDSKRIIHPKQLSIQGVALKLIKDLK